MSLDCAHTDEVRGRQAGATVPVLLSERLLSEARKRLSGLAADCRASPEPPVDGAETCRDQFQ